MPTSGDARSIKEITEREGVNPSYVGRMLNLTGPTGRTACSDAQPRRAEPLKPGETAHQRGA